MSEAPGVCLNSFNFKEFMNLESSNDFRAKRGFSVPAKHDAPQQSSCAPVGAQAQAEQTSLTLRSVFNVFLFESFDIRKYVL